MSLLSALVLVALAASKDPSAQCGSGSHWVSAHHRRGYLRANGTFVKETDVQAHCQKNPKGYTQWNPRLANGRPKHWGTPNVTPGEWTAEERERVLEALAALPEFLKNQDFDAIYRMHNPGEPDNPGGTMGTNIVLYDAAFDEKHNLAQVLAHEMAHRYFNINMSPEQQKSFLDAAKWQTSDGGKTYTHRPDNQFLRPQGRLSFHEDFADSVAGYVLNPVQLKTTSPGVFNWMDQHIGPKMRARGGK